MDESIATKTNDRASRDARLTLFGSPTRAAVVDVTPRPRHQRMVRALATLGVTILLAALVGIIPPHVPWILGVLALGAWRTRGEWKGEYALHAFAGPCPRCGEPLRLEEKFITPPLAVPCYSCHAQPQLQLE